MVKEKAGGSFSPHENNFGCPTIFNMYLFTMLKLLARDSFFFLKKNVSLINLFIFIYLFVAVLGLRFCARAFSSCGERGPLFIAVRGPLSVAASLVVEHRLQTRSISSCGSRA